MANSNVALKSYNTSLSKERSPAYYNLMSPERLWQSRNLNGQWVEQTEAHQELARATTSISHLM